MGESVKLREVGGKALKSANSVKLGLELCGGLPLEPRRRAEMKLARPDSHVFFTSALFLSLLPCRPIDSYPLVNPTTTPLTPTRLLSPQIYQSPLEKLYIHFLSHPPHHELPIPISKRVLAQGIFQPNFLLRNNPLHPRLGNNTQRVKV